MRFADNSPDPQIHKAPTSTAPTVVSVGANLPNGLQKEILAEGGEDETSSESTIDEVAGEMASKAGKHEKAHESDDVVGGVRSNSGGIFSK